MAQLTTPQKILVFGGGALVLAFFLMITCLLPGLRRCSTGGNIDLTVWGVYDTSGVWDKIFRDFRSEHPTINLTYKQIPFDEYQDDLLNAFAAQNGPDLFYLQNTGLPQYLDKVTPMPTGSGFPTFSDYRSEFVDVVSSDFTRNQSTVYAVPLYMDTLALYYNKDLLNSAGITTPPKTWDEFQNDVERLTIIDSNGHIVRSGAAMGTARNINRSTDIFSLLMLQTFGDTQFIFPDSKEAKLSQVIGTAGGFSPGVEALRFYTDFANPAVRSYAWNRDQHYSIDAFVEGNVAMMVNYSHHITTIRERAPQLSFGIARVPQPTALANQQKAIDYANYFGLTAAKTSDKRRSKAAWQFLTFLTSANEQQAYAKATGRLSARRDLLAPLQSDPDFGIFAQESLTARSWYQPETRSVETILADMIESVIDGTAVREALNRAEGDINVLMKKAQ